MRQVAYVPDSGHKRLIALVRDDREMKAVPLTTEEEGVALSVGAWLGGDRSVLLTQSSGVGNCINMIAMSNECRTPLLMLVTMRGEWGEFNPWQIPMGTTTEAALKLTDVHVLRADLPGEVGEVVAAAATMAFDGEAAVAVLLGQRLIGAKVFANERD